MHRGFFCQHSVFIQYISVLCIVTLEYIFFRAEIVCLVSDEYNVVISPGILCFSSGIFYVSVLKVC